MGEGQGPRVTMKCCDSGAERCEGGHLVSVLLQEITLVLHTQEGQCGVGACGFLTPLDWPFRLSACLHSVLEPLSGLTLSQGSALPRAGSMAATRIFVIPAASTPVTGVSFSSCGMNKPAHTV